MARRSGRGCEDTLGSGTEIFKDIAITKPAVPTSNDVLLEVLHETAASGEPLATPATINAVASTSVNNDVQFSGKLLDVFRAAAFFRILRPLG